MTARNAAALEQHDFDEYEHFVARGAADDDDAFSTRTTNTARARRTWKADRTRRSTTMHLCRALARAARLRHPAEGLDFTSAFNQCKLPHPVHLRMPPGFQHDGCAIRCTSSRRVRRTAMRDITICAHTSFAMPSPSASSRSSMSVRSCSSPTRSRRPPTSTCLRYSTK